MLALACASPGLAQSIGSPVGGGGTVLAPVDEPRPAALDPKKCEDDCPAVPIACGDTMMGTISSVDFADDQGRHFDIYSFSGTSGDQITATLFSNAFEPHLELRTPGGEDAAEAEGEDPGSTARIDYTLTATSTGWRLIAKSGDAADLGTYTLALVCDGGSTPPPPPPPGTPTIACGETVMSTIEAQDSTDDQGRHFDTYRFSGSNGDQITATLFSNAFEPHLELRTSSNEDAAEAEGQNPGSTAQLDYTLTSTSNNWRLIAKADSPAATGAYSLTLMCGGGGTPPPPPPPGFFADPAYPDFRFRVTIGNPGSTIAGRREADCQPDTVCVSGGLAGRSELFVRLLGPRPNGFLWPTIVRFTPSRVVVDIQQVSSGEMQTYTLPAVPPGTDDLRGLQDRTGFMP
jgi:hypothetical protein